MLLHLLHAPTPFAAHNPDINSFSFKKMEGHPAHGGRGHSELVWTVRRKRFDGCATPGYTSFMPGQRAKNKSLVNIPMEDDLIALIDQYARDNKLLRSKNGKLLPNRAGAINDIARKILGRRKK